MCQHLCESDVLVKLTVAELKVGQQASVTSVEGADSIAARLMEMGIIPGTEIKLIGVAPLGDPLEIEVRGYRLSLRKSEASRVQISLIDE